MIVNTTANMIGRLIVIMSGRQFEDAHRRRDFAHRMTDFNGVEIGNIMSEILACEGAVAIEPAI